MSRAFRIRVSESLTRVIRASDHVGTQLELLDVLPREAMAALLARELEAAGFEQGEGGCVRTEDGITVVVDPETGSVTVRAEAESNLELKAERDGVYYDDQGPGRKSAEAAARTQAKKELESTAESREKELRREVTDRLEGHLADVQRDLNGVVNRVTAEALKQKAAQMGEIKEMTEDAESGSLTIVVEV